VAYFDIGTLEKQVDELIDCCRRLQEENQALRAGQAQSAAEQAELVQKTDQARGRIEAALTRLKSMEEGL